ncbi:MAG: tetratricopeptide repeat protein [Kiritimatiellia bacterium]
MLLEQADQSFETSALQDAGRLYGATVRAYEQFMISFPDFAPDLVRFRIAYCRNQMDLIRQKRNNLQENNAKQPQEQPIERKPMALPASILVALQNEENSENLRAQYESMARAREPAAPLLRATMLVREGNLLAARNLLEQFIIDHPANPAAHYNLAQVILRDTQPDMEKAREHYRRAIENGAPRDQDLEIVINF